jgi:hypothetical protein
MSNKMDRSQIVYLTLFPEWKYIGERNCILLRKITYLMDLKFPVELIKKINMMYIVHEVSKSNPGNRIKCSKIECIYNWNTHFKIGTDLTKFNNILHCDNSQCHMIFIPNKSSLCKTCRKYFCKSCKDGTAKKKNTYVELEVKSYDSSECGSCIISKVGEGLGIGECTQQ